METLPPHISAQVDAFLADPSSGVRRRRPAKVPNPGDNFEVLHMPTTDPFTGQHVGEQTIIVHAKSRCQGPACCIHNPSDHHMVDWPQLWRADRNLMERTCPHGIGHPDPDHIGDDLVHGCDGCCSKPRSQ